MQTMSHAKRMCAGMKYPCARSHEERTPGNMAREERRTRRRKGAAEGSERRRGRGSGSGRLNAYAVDFALVEPDVHVWVLERLVDGGAPLGVDDEHARQEVARERRRQRRVLARVRREQLVREQLHSPMYTHTYTETETEAET